MRRLPLRPGEKYTPEAKFKGLGQLFSYLADTDAPLRKRAEVSDASCTAAGCHADDGFETKEVAFTEKVGFVHRAHEEKTIEGQTLHCTTCHVHTSAEKHFEVPREVCFLCHFRETEFNKGRGACALCHEIPTISLQSQKSEDSSSDAGEPITHQSLEAAGVACGSCHHDVVVGNGELKIEGCRNCHDAAGDLERIDDRRLMHEKHVATQQAQCFDCHQPIAHAQAEDFLDSVRLVCQNCHPDHHRFQKQLLVGAAAGDVPETPALMQSVGTNCLGCHIAQGHAKGQPFLKGSPDACIACHTERHGEMVEK